MKEEESPYEHCLDAETVSGLLAVGGARAVDDGVEAFLALCDHIELEELGAGGRQEELTRTARELGAAAASIGAETVSELADQVAELGVAGHSVQLDQLVEQLAVAMGETVACLKRVREGAA